MPVQACPADFVRLTGTPVWSSRWLGTPRRPAATGPQLTRIFGSSSGSPSGSPSIPLDPPSANQFNPGLAEEMIICLLCVCVCVALQGYQVTSSKFQLLLRTHLTQLSVLPPHLLSGFQARSHAFSSQDSVSSRYKDCLAAWASNAAGKSPFPPKYEVPLSYEL